MNEYQKAIVDDIMLMTSLDGFVGMRWSELYIDPDVGVRHVYNRKDRGLYPKAYPLSDVTREKLKELSPKVLVRVYARIVSQFTKYFG